MHLLLAGRINFALSVIGAVAFAALFLYAAIAPQSFDRKVRDFAISYAEKRLDQSLGGAVNQKTVKRASSLAGSVLRKLQRHAEDHETGRLAWMQRQIAGHYQKIMDKLRADVLVFSASSFLAFFFAIALSLWRGKAARHLLPISIALTASTVLAAAWYIFGQDWVMAIIFSDYWGWGYAAFLSVICGFMLDIAINKARLTSMVLNLLGSVFGAALHFTPC